MKKPGHEPPSREADELAPPFQQGKRLSAEERQSAMENALRDGDSLKLVLYDQKQAIRKWQHYDEHHETPGAANFKASADATVEVITNWIQSVFGRLIDRNTTNRQNASQRRGDPLTREVRLLVAQNIEAQAKVIYRQLAERAGQDDSPVIAFSDQGIHWKDSAGTTQVTPFDDNFEDRVSRARSTATDN